MGVLLGNVADMEIEVLATGVRFLIKSSILCEGVGVNFGGNLCLSL